MKGTLIKTEKDWMVYHKVDEKTPIGYKSWWETLPLHPNDTSTCIQYGDYSVDWHGKEVEFDFVTEWENGEVGVNGLTYAKLIYHPVDTNKMICMFEPRTDTSSATICKHCGKEKFLHNQVPEVKKMVEITFLEIGRKRWEDWLEFNKKACYPDEYQSAYADGFTRGAKWMQEQLKQPKQ